MVPLRSSIPGRGQRRSAYVDRRFVLHTLSFLAAMVLIVGRLRATVITA